MAHAGGVKPSVEMEIVNGVLVVGEQAQRIGVINSVDIAVQELLLGKKVFVQQYGDLTNQVKRTVDMALKAALR